MQRETKNIEYKEKITKTYLKTVSAFANYGTGKIFFGISDQGKRIGIPDPEKAVLNLENQINDNISPHPDFTFAISDDNVIELSVQKGKDTPYCYQGKAYKRNGSSTIEVTSFEFKNLVLKGMNLSFTEIPTDRKDLTFETFERTFFDQVGISARFPDTWITLSLFDSQGGFTNAALLLSSQNSFPGIDIVSYGKDQSCIRNRYRLENQSVLDQISESIRLFEEQYTYEKVEGLYREVREMIPLSAFKEAITNAIVHREWQIPAWIKVEFFPDYVTITSPGGLPEGMSAEDYLSDRHVSILRNQSLALVFLRLRLIETLGSGIPSILNKYASSYTKPDFRITENMLSISLPKPENVPELSIEQKKIYDAVRFSGPVSPAELQKSCEMSKSTIQRILKNLLDLKLIAKSGKGPAVRYFTS